MGSGDPLLVRAISRAGPRLSSELVWSVIRGTPRSLAADAARLSALLRPPAKVEGMEHIPPREPFLLIANHYQAADLWVGWVALAITGAVAAAREPEVRETHWMMASEWGQPSLGVNWVSNPLTSLLFPRAATVWGAVAVPADPADVRGRARALRQVLAYLGRQGKHVRSGGEPAAMFPEGTASVALREARPGSGAFLSRVSDLGVRLLPVGVHDEGGALSIRFGEPYRLSAGDKDREELDDWARREVMASIARLLPERLWGAYADTVRESRESGVEELGKRSDRPG